MELDAEQFLDMFDRELFVFLSKDDGQGKKDPKLTKRYGAIWHKAGTFDQCEKWLGKNNSEGWGCFFAVNKLDPRLDADHKRTEAMLTQISAIWCEDDTPRGQARMDWPITPNLVVNTSPNKYHYYWLTSLGVSAEEKEEWKRVMATMVDVHGCDNQAKDLLRVLRLPGFYHVKNIKQPFRVTCELTKATEYAWSDITKAFPPAATTITQTHREAGEGGERTTLASLVAAYEEGHRHGPSSRGAWLLAKQGMGSDDIYTVISTLFPEEDEAHHRQSISSAVEKIAQEKAGEQPGSVASAEDAAGPPPKFNHATVHGWPDPWPLIFKTYHDAIYQVIEEIYIPACFALHTVVLGSIFRTVRNRGPNLNIQIISASGIGKDSNTSEPIGLLHTAIERHVRDNGNVNLAPLINLFSPIYQGVTGDTTYLKALQDERHVRGGLVLNTEASGHWDMVASADNPHTEGVMRIEINAWDGQRITGKLVGKEQYGNIVNPNYTCVRLQQTEALEQNLTQRMVDIGLGNRIDFYLDSEDRPETASTEFNSKRIEIDEEYLDFISYVLNFINTHQGLQIKVRTGAAGGEIAKFEKERLLPLVNGKDGKPGEVDRNEYKFIKRIIGSAEKQVTAITAFAYLWRLHKRLPTTDIVAMQVGDVVVELDGGQFEEQVAEMMEYQLAAKRYLYKNVIANSQASAENDAISEAWARLIERVPQREAPWFKRGGVVAATFHRRVRVHKFFRGAAKYDAEKIHRAIQNWTSIHGIRRETLSCEEGRRTCYIAL